MRAWIASPGNATDVEGKVGAWMSGGGTKSAEVGRSIPWISSISSSREDQPGGMLDLASVRTIIDLAAEQKAERFEKIAP
jgi:hypothetical protein